MYFHTILKSAGLQRLGQVIRDLANVNEKASRPDCSWKCPCSQYIVKSSFSFLFIYFLVLGIKPKVLLAPEANTVKGRLESR